MTHTSDPIGAACIGVDVGGTFTDVVLADDTRIWRAKAASTHGELGRGVLTGRRLVAERAGTTLEELLPRVVRFGLGTTAVTNAIASRTGRRVGLLTTEGFEDLVPIARGIRSAHDGWLVPPESLVDPECIAGVPERLDRLGRVVRELDVPALLVAAERLVTEYAVEALVVSFLWSHVNDSHERAAAEALALKFTDLPVMSGAALLPVIREYDRTQYALLNAYTSGALNGVEALARELAELGLPHPPMLVHSGGGVISIAEGRRVPATLAESGPAAGVVAALAVCEATGVTDAVTGDVGGTSFDVSLITRGEPSRRTRGDLMGVWTALPMIDIDSVGSGGGSVGWIDPLGILRVGPKSAGAQPGPACYGRGGTEATVTDALVVLGYLDPARFLGGEIELDREAAVAACARLGENIGLDAERTAHGIREVAEAGMVRALRARFAERGFDPRTFTLISMGGCGSLFSVSIARELHIGRVLVPELASVFSAFGAATSDVRRERTQSVGFAIQGDPRELGAVVDDLVAAVSADLAADGVPAAATSITVGAELRFAKQRYELPVEFSGGLDTASQLAVRDRFIAEYSARYGEGALVSGAPVEIAALKATGVGATTRARLTAQPAGQSGPAPVHSRRPILGGSTTRPRQTPVVRGEDLRPGHTITGPAVVDARDTTVWLPPGCTAHLDSYRTIDVRISL
ncbi:hydantoinase/oxoprolinase family protein [Amycolatopsis sp. NPDC049253]|uniref:hydantoinase/oxoprolinase family protein n=1 Tax=Amycolatopsis sp. NPDC049253 TaxID=3155274 RepID=UPI00341727DB